MCGTRCPVTKTPTAQSLAADLHALTHLSDADLLGRWKAAYGQVPLPGSRRDFLLGCLAYHLQQQAAGDLAPKAKKRLRDVARSLAQGMSSSPAALGPL